MYSFVGVRSGDSKRGTLGCGLEDLKRECFTFNGTLSQGVRLFPNVLHNNLNSPFISQRQRVINVISLRLYVNSHLWFQSAWLKKKKICFFCLSRQRTMAPELQITSIFIIDFLNYFINCFVYKMSERSSNVHRNFSEPKMAFSTSTLVVLSNWQFKN